MTSFCFSINNSSTSTKLFGLGLLFKTLPNTSSDDVFGRVLNSNPNPNNLVEVLELLILKQKLVLLFYI